MPKITRPTVTHVQYTEAEVRDLIIRDLAENHNVHVTRADVLPHVVGGGTHVVDEDARSWGGPTIGSGFKQVGSARFDGYLCVGNAIEGEGQIERDSKLASTLTEMNTLEGLR